MMIKLQDFARECGVTDRTIQKHVAKHEEALAGHFERKGPNGTWLDEYAQEYIRGLMIQPPPPVLGDAQTARENEDLKQENQRLNEKIQFLLAENAKLQGIQGRLEGAEESKRILQKNLDAARYDQDLIRAENKELNQKLLESNGRATEYRVKLEAEINRPLTLRERITGKKIPQE